MSALIAFYFRVSLKEIDEMSDEDFAQNWAALQFSLSYENARTAPAMPLKTGKK